MSCLQVAYSGGNSAADWGCGRAEWEWNGVVDGTWEEQQSPHDTNKPTRLHDHLFTCK